MNMKASVAIQLVIGDNIPTSCLIAAKGNFIQSRDISLIMNGTEIRPRVLGVKGALYLSEFGTMRPKVGFLLSISKRQIHG